MEAKRIAAERAVQEVKEGMVVGLGTGSTAYWAIQKLGEQVKQGLTVKAVATSTQSENLAKEAGIPIVSFADIDTIDIAIDGADEVDQKGNLIKGGGGALLREKIIAANSNRFLVIVDESKLVTILGKFPLPVEIVPFAAELTVKKIKALGTELTIRKQKEKYYITDNGNWIADCRFNEIMDPALLNEQLHQIPGVVETGLFLNTMVNAVIVGFKNGMTNIFFPSDLI